MGSLMGKAASVERRQCTRVYYSRNDKTLNRSLDIYSSLDPRIVRLICVVRILKLTLWLFYGLQLGV